ncbi:MAG: histidine kinase [Solirubrobacteraceae bacterium]|nr:histidine kinase [Solirubrobacteraceae bacterium]
MAQPTTARSSDLPRWLRSALPADLIDADDQDRGRRDRLVDGAMYLFAFAGGAITIAETWELHPPWWRGAALVTGIVVLVSLRWRRTHPAAVGIFAAATAMIVITASGASLVAIFNAAIRVRGGALAVVAGLSIASCFTIPLAYSPRAEFWGEVGVGLLCTGVAFGWGLFVRARRELVRTLRERAAHAEVETRAAERSRIAREMHDVLAHRLSLLSVHAGALEFHPDAPAAEVAEAAGVIRESAKAALEELRDVIGVLREDGGERPIDPPQPTLADLPALIAESSAAGMRLTTQIDLGDEPAPAALGRTAYRVVQEGLTNARKHAPGAAVTLTLRAADRALEIDVRSLAAVAVAAEAPLPGAGTGLIGLTERVSLAGGELEHGIDRDGAFVLRARLPR